MESMQDTPAPGPSPMVAGEPRAMGPGMASARVATDGGSLSRRQAARIAGVASLAMAVAAIFANSLVLLRLVEPDDAVATAGNIAASAGLFRAGLAGFTVVFLLDVVVAWALHVFFRSVRSDLSLLAAWFRVTYAAILGVALLHLAVAAQLAGDVDAMTALGGQGHAQVLLSVDAFYQGWTIGLVCFAVHLLLISVLALTSGEVPRVLGVLLGLAGLGYAVDGFAHLLLASYDDYAQVFLAIVAVPSVAGEVGFALWLLLRGARGRRRDETALAVG